MLVLTSTYVFSTSSLSSAIYWLKPSTDYYIEKIAGIINLGLYVGNTIRGNEVIDIIEVSQFISARLALIGRRRL